MKVQELEARITNRMSGLLDEECRLQDWLECLRRVEAIAAQWQTEPKAAEPLLESRCLGEEDETPTTRLAAAAAERAPGVSSPQAFEEGLDSLREEPVAGKKPEASAADPLDRLREQLVAASGRSSRLRLGSVFAFVARA